MKSSLSVLLVKPSKYDDDGFVVRFFRGVLPSNTLATLAGLTRDAVENGKLGDARVEFHVFDEQVQTIRPRRLVRRHRRRAERVLVALCGVQSNQFPRAADLAREFRREGASVMIGGFHVSGSLAMSPTGMVPECREMLDEGVTLVRGEVEDAWAGILADAVNDRLRPMYEISTPPTLDEAAMPEMDERVMRRFVARATATLDAGRGCPFNCSFCTIINVQGRKMRCRSAERVAELVRSNAARGVTNYFFTDDNFARNPQWEPIFDALIALRRDEGVPVEFMMQVDVLAARRRRFVEKAGAAGCREVFIGMESINPDNLEAAGKSQNDASHYREMTDAWHAQGISCHVGYIVGFPHDTVESVRADVERLSEEIGVDQASFFMLTPLPGSQDRQELVERGAWIDDDFNKLDSDHATTQHPLMSAEEWLGAYRDAWARFYEVGSMIRILRRSTRDTYWTLFRNFLWYKYAVFVEGLHPMLGGFFRLKTRTQRRPGFAVESRARHALRRARDMAECTRGLATLYAEMQEVWLATRDVARVSRRPRIFRPRVRTRIDLDAYWRQTFEALRRGRVLRINPLRLARNGLRDAALAVSFGASLIAARAR